MKKVESKRSNIAAFVIEGNIVNVTSVKRMNVKRRGNFDDVIIFGLIDLAVIGIVDIVVDVGEGDKDQQSRCWKVIIV